VSRNMLEVSALDVLELHLEHARLRPLRPVSLSPNRFMVNIGVAGN
jgi:hypothetical protein